jgi:tetratricopeptide (TPR) repeat protein
MNRLYALIPILLVVTLVVGCDRSRIAQAAMYAKKYELAAELYREYLAENPRSVLALRHLAQIECYELAEFDSCVAHADTLLEIYAVDTAGVAAATYGHTMLAGRALNISDTTRVRWHMDRIAAIHRYAGHWNYMNENYARAEHNFRQFIHVQPDSAYGYLRLGIVRWNQMRDDSALVWFRRAEEVDSLNEDALINQIVVLRNTGQYDDAEAAADRLEQVRTRLYPDSIFAYEPDTIYYPPMSLDFRGDTTHWSEHYQYGTGF